MEKNPRDVNYDSLQKIQPILVNLNQNFNDVVKQEICQSADEQMTPFKGKQSLKVYMVKEKHANNGIQNMDKSWTIRICS